MRNNAAFCHGLLSTSDAFKNSHALLHKLESLNINKVCARKPVLRDEDRLLVPPNVREEFSRLALECGDKFDSHGE